MGIIMENGLVETLCALLLVGWMFFIYLTKNYGYWADKGVPFKIPEFPYGSLKDVALAKESMCHGHDKVYKQFPDERFYGIINFRKPALVIKDPELVKRVLVKDFQHFVDRPTLVANPKEYIIQHLLTLTGQEWKSMRAKLTPTFTSGKLKLMFALMERCSEELKGHMEKELKEKHVIDAKDLLARFTLEIIASCAFGIDTNSISDKNTKFFQVMGGTMRTTKMRYVRRLCLILFPSVFRLLKVNLVSPKVTAFVTSVVRDNVEYRKANRVTRNDFLDLLVNIKHKSADETQENNETEIGTHDGLTLEQMTAQTFVFFIAGFETASSLMAFCLYELACNKNVQDTLYQELERAMEKSGGKISYEMLTTCDYLDQVINETLRLYGSAHTLTRKCTKRYQLPDTEVIVEEGMDVVVPLFSLHHDPLYYPDPYAFKPERFTPENGALRHPFVFLPFGEGPRNCIGMRFGMMQARVGLATVALNYLVELSPEQEVPIEIDKKSAALMPAKPVLLKFIARNSQIQRTSEAAMTTDC